MLIMGVIALILIVGAYLASNFYLTSLRDELAVADNQYLNIDDQRDKNAEEEINILNRQLGLINGLLDNHVFWSTGFNKLETLTLTTLRFKSLVGTSDAGRIDFQVTTNNYTDIARQIAAYLSDDSIIDVNISNTSVLANGQIDSDLSVEFDSIDFLRK